MSDGAQMDLLTRIEASLEFMNDGGPIRVDFVNLREVLEGSREALLKLDEYERREKLHMDRCRHDMERIVRLEQQLEKCEAERAKYESWFYEKFGQAFEAEEDLDALLEANRDLQAKLDRYRTALKAVVDACDLPDAW